ncbi:DUF1015 domain-containing protein [Algoriphagus vanfongensis]|uniref:DUF1015 domain-containing protein n=1 Tax=Algoriphagus vanfongensis TaxID=426371 RepID=UPI00041418E0|nr:DUF1015 domain-containing protein [Algoriphagus vanfongensis]
MAQLLPLRAWRYADRFTENMEDLIAPLFDVVSINQREKLYENPLNSIHLAVPKGMDASLEASKTVMEWKSKGIIQQDAVAGIYVYYQYFRLPGEKEERCRKGFIAHVKAYDWEEKQILRHENTIVSAVKDRVDLLRATQIQASPTHGLYEDENFELEEYLDKAISQPIYEIEDYQGVREVLAVIQDGPVIRKILDFLSQKQIILADGHHRLEGAISYKHEKEGSSSDKKWKGHEFHLMYLTNAFAKDLKILPTHRLFYGLEMGQETFLAKLEEWFDVSRFLDAEELGTYAFHSPFTFGLLIGGEAYFLKLKVEKYWNLLPDLVPELKELDLVALHELVFHQILGMDQEKQRSSDQLVYERNFSRCLQEVRSGKATFAVITRELRMEEVLKVCKSGNVMPQKSTYFYPKAVGGLLFGSIAQDEFDYDYDAFFGKTEE